MPVRNLWIATPFLVLLSSCMPAPTSEPTPDAGELVAALAEEAWQHTLANVPYLQMRHGSLLRELPDLTPEKARADAEYARSMLERIDAIAPGDLSHEDVLTPEVLRWDFERVVEAEPFYWLGFPVTPYGGSFFFGPIHQAMGAYPFKQGEEHTAVYLTLLAEYADMLEQIEAHLEGQMERGIFLPEPALPAVIAMFESFRGSARSLIGVAPERLEALASEARESFLAAVDDVITSRVEPGFDGLLAVLKSERYRGGAPKDVGLAQYPDGEAFYRHQVKLHTTMEIIPEELHELGKKRVGELMAEMAAIRAELGFEGTQAEFHDQLRKDPAFLARTPEEVEARFNAYVERIEPLVPDYFSRTPKAPYGVGRLDESAEGSMTYGFYQAPTPTQPRGVYRYNGSQLDQRSLIFAGPLIYHELVPGHHFQIALQNENEELVTYRRNVGAGAFIEGWGNYAALLATEMGLLEDPYDRYGWAIFDMFITVRLVVDTGMNLLGWSLEEGRDYMRRHTFQSETEIATESLRYSTDIPGQALAYKAGLEKLLELRRKVRESAGEDFDVRTFHDVVLASGALPLSVLEKHLERTFG